MSVRDGQEAPVASNSSRGSRIQLYKALLHTKTLCV